MLSTWPESTFWGCRVQVSLLFPTYQPWSCSSEVKGPQLPWPPSGMTSCTPPLGRLSLYHSVPQPDSSSVLGVGCDIEVQ